MKDNTYKNGDYVVALDIGTTKICTIVGRKNEHGRVEVVGMGKVESSGVMRGVVANIEKTVSAISDSLDMAEKNAEVSIKDVHVGIAGQHVKSHQHRGYLVRQYPDTEIDKGDIDKLISDVYKLSLGPGVKILHVIPQEYTVDGEPGIVDPIGMSGNKIEANFHIITGQITSFNNINKCVQKAGLEVAEMTLEPIASASSVLSEKEMEAGVALVDIGGGTTDITIIQEGIIRHTAVVPFGGNIITKDIKEGCGVMQDQAEKLKVRFGSAAADLISDNRIITIPGFNGNGSKEITEKNLARIIQARVEEILRYVVFEIKRSGYEKKLIGGVVLTGGGSLLRNLDKLTEFYTAKPSRIGYPTEHLAHGYSESLNSPIFATGVGLLCHAIHRLESNVITVGGEIKVEKASEQPMYIEDEVMEETSTTTNNFEFMEKKKPSLIDKVFTSAKNFFEAKPDSEY